MLGLYRSKHKYELIRWENDLSYHEQKSVAVTFSTQLEELDHQSPDASTISKVLSFFDPESIPLSMITEGAEGIQHQSTSYSHTLDLASNVISQKRHLWQSILRKFKTKWDQRSGHPSSIHTITPINDISFINPKLEPLTALISSPVRLQQAIQQLHQLSLIRYEPNTNTPTLRIHELIQLMIRERTRREDTQHHWFHAAVTLACSAFRHVEYPTHEHWPRCEILSPHIQSLKMWDDEHSIGSSYLGRANIKIAQYLDSQGRYSEAETLIESVLTSNERLFGPEHEATLWAMKNLADVYESQRRYNAAETLYGLVLKGYEK